MSEFDYNIIIFHYNEIGIKSDKVRLRMELQLIRNAAATYRKFGIDYKEIKREFGRIYFYISPKDMDKAIIASKFVIGVFHFSVAIECDTDINIIAENVLKIFNKKTEDGSNRNFRTIAISSRRVKAYPMTSPQISAFISEKLVDSHPHLKINLNKADFHLFVEIRENKAFLYEQQIEAYLQGLPVESSKMVLGQSFGRFSDLVSTIMMMKRGVFVQQTYFNLGKFGSPKQSMFQDKLQYLPPLMPSPIYCLEIPFEPILEIIKGVSLSNQVSPCPLCFFVRMKLLGKLVDHINDGYLAKEEISESLELGEDVEVNNIKKKRTKKRGFFKGVTIGLNETAENYCGTGLHSLIPFIDHPHLILTPCVVFDNESFEYQRKIIKEMDIIRQSGVKFDEIYAIKENVCELVKLHQKNEEEMSTITESLTKDQRAEFMKDLKPEILYSKAGLEREVDKAINSIKINLLL